MRVGFTGTRKGMTLQQHAQLKIVLRALFAHQNVALPSHGHPSEFHHGAAVGADTEAATEAAAQGFTIMAWPAYHDPLARNRDIVAAVDILVAAPRTDQEELRSGTWATVRYARQKGIPIVFLTRGKT